ncbi:hypothetical protein ACFE04_016587 [Oxalis oulophora]
MSSSSYYLSISLLLCVLIHASHARPLGVINDGNKNNIINKLEGISAQYSSNKIDDTANAHGTISSVEIKNSSLSKELVNQTKLNCDINLATDINDQCNKNKAKIPKAAAKRARLNQKSSKKHSKKNKRSVSHIHDDESLTSVSWRVPHKKSNERHPGFSLDYAPPRTHPPSHN